MTGTNGQQDAANAQEMDELFRRTDFAADVPFLKERIWQRIQARMSDRELLDDELEELAAAGVPYFLRDGPKPGGACK